VSLDYSEPASLLREMNKSDDDLETVNDDNIQAVQEVTKMKATSTTSSTERDQSSPDLQGEGKTVKKKKLFLSKEKKEQAEHSKKCSPVAEVKEALDAVKTNKRISLELPKCNWLEDKIKDLELTKRAEECRRLIEEELSTRRSISCLGEKVQEESNLKIDQTLKRVTSAFPETIAIENDELTQEAGTYLTGTPVQDLTGGCVEPGRIIGKGSIESIGLITEIQKQNENIKSIQKIQDELMLEKKTLLKDIRIIQKRKIKEMEELIDIKLKKETFEQELEKTRLEIKKMDEYFDNVRKRKLDQPDEHGKAPRRAKSTDESSQKVDSDIKIIDFKTAKDDRPPRPSENQMSTTVNNQNQQIRHDKNINVITREKDNAEDIQSIPPTSQHAMKKQSEKLRIGMNSMGNPIVIQDQQLTQSMPSLSKNTESFRPPQIERQVPRQVAPYEEKSLPSLQQLNYQEQKANFEQLQRRTPSHENQRQVSPQNEQARNSPITEQYSRGRDPNELTRSQEDRKQFYSQQVQTYKTQRNQESYLPYPPPVQQFREYKDAILIPVNNKPIPRNEQLLPSKEQYIRELQENNYEKQQYQRAIQLPSPPPYQSVNSFITQHEAMINQRYQDNLHIPLRPVPQRSAPIPRIPYLHQNQQNLLPYHEQQAAHIRHLSMQKRREIERYIPQIAQEIKRPNVPIQPRKAALPDEKCEACGKEANFMCSACKGAHYCSTVCQKERWAEHCKNCIKF